MNFKIEAIQFLEKIESKLRENKIILEPHWDIDHLCYRVNTVERYLHFKKEFSLFSDLLTESEVNGRMISTFELHDPVYYKSWQIDVVELPAPKFGKKTIEGFEHIEVVSDLSAEEIQSRFNNLQLDKSGLKKKINQELEVCMGEINIKFHAISLKSLINLENNKKIWKAVNKSQVLNVLQSFRPLIAGTFPLGLQTENSDLDILIYLKNKDELKSLATATWSNADSFSMKELRLDNLETLIISFKYDGVPFEIFAQNQEPVKQNAYRHFLIEERILKLKGPQFANKILEFKKSGIKTEPAFAQALGLNGDPYEALLKLQFSSSREIIAY